MSMYMGNDQTIKGYIKSYRADEMTIDAFYLQDVFEDKSGGKMIVNGSPILPKYMPELRSIVEKHELTDDEYYRWRFNPKRMSYDLYGTTELWTLLLDINELTSVTQFNTRVLKVFPASIIDRLQRVINLERLNKDYNAEEVSAALLS